LPLPCVVTVKEGINLPRYPSLPGRLRAKRASITRVPAGDPALALTLARGLAAEAGTGVAGVVFCARDRAPASGLAAYGAADVYVVPGVDGYAPQAWARAL